MCSRIVAGTDAHIAPGKLPLHCSVIRCLWYASSSPRYIAVIDEHGLSPLGRHARARTLWTRLQPPSARLTERGLRRGPALGRAGGGPAGELLVAERSTKAEVQTPATLDHAQVVRQVHLRSTKARVQTLATHAHSPAVGYTLTGAQRRPECKLRRPFRTLYRMQWKIADRSAKARAQTPATPCLNSPLMCFPSTLNEGQSTNSSDTPRFWSRYKTETSMCNLPILWFLRAINLDALAHAIATILHARAAE